MHHLKAVLCTVFSLLICSQSIAIEPQAQISRINGEAKITRKGSSRSRSVRINMPVAVGDKISSGKESMVEITFKKGEVVRMDENSILKVEKSDDKTVRTSSQIGNLWVNMKKLSKRRDFELSSPTAVAAIRGTIFHMGTDKDSTTAVSVFDGKVAVGLNKEVKKKIEKQKSCGEPVEVPGPEEVPGPYEVSLDQWMDIVAGQKISVRKDGKYATEEFNKEQGDEFMKKNMNYDAQK
ncbi:MAG: FecR domain-containing protein [Chitinispirillaceae bacterium]